MAVVLELARLWSKTDYRPARSVLFAAWIAQESGQIGSTCYVENPIFPLDQTWAMIQLDAVGGERGNCLDASGVFEQDGLLIGRTAILQDLVDVRVNMNQKPLNETIRPSMSQWLQWPEDDHIEESDHLSFRNVGIPSLLLRWCGAEETNEPLGESDTVLPEKLEVTGRVVSLLVMTLAR